jgi:very-short-patch-repair endonuclease
MDPTSLQSAARGIWMLAARQHGAVARSQLLDLGCSSDWIAHRIARGRLHRVRRGVYAIGRPQLTREGQWMAAVLACGPEAVLSHASAAALWGVAKERASDIHVSVPFHVNRSHAGIRVHRRAALSDGEIEHRLGIPVTSVTATLIDVAATLEANRLEAAINEADKLDLIDLERLRATLDERSPRPGLGRLRATLDRRTFTLTDSELERRFLPLARRVGLPLPAPRDRKVNGFDVDFFWPELGLVVETDGLRYHRTPAQQAKDRVRDQVHAAAGLTPLRFTRAQVRFEPAHVQATLAAVVRWLRATHRD